MENERQASIVFKVENCRAKYHTADLVDCLSPQQAHLCGHSLPFGYGYFCKHPRRKEFIEMTEMWRNPLNSATDVSQSDNQE